MPVAITEMPVASPLPMPARKRWTRAELATIQAHGVLADQHLELVGGELINKMGKNRPHVNALVMIMEWLVSVFGKIADSSLAFDLTTKAALYARAAIPEYWVLDCNGRRLFVHRDPVSGVYRSVVAYAEGESVGPLAAKDREFRVGDAFPSAIS